MSIRGRLHPLPLSCLALLCVFSIAATAPAAHADPENFSGLKGKDLVVGSGDSGGGRGTSFGDLLGKIFKSKNKGTISRVHVLSDRADSLTVQISYGDLKDDAQRTLSLSATDGSGRALRGIKTAKTTITGTQGEATVKLEMAPDAAPGTILDQSTLQVQIVKGSALKQEVVMDFQCPKQWRKAPSSVVAQPFGKSLTLPAKKPVKGIGPRPHVKAYRVKSAPASEKDPTAVSVQPAATSSSASSIKFKPAGSTPLHVINPQLQELTLATDILGLPGDVKNNNGRGPGASYLRPFDVIEMEPGLSDQGLTHLHPNIYEDENPASGYFYYLPAGYYLYWDEDTGYALRILYGAAATEGTANNVSVAARLTTGVESADIALASKILRDYCNANNRVFKELRPFPFSSMAISLKNDIGGQYNIPADKISVTGITDIAGLIDFSLSTDPVTKENLQLVLTQGLGINGQVTYQSASDQGAGGLQVTIPLRLKFADPDSFGDRPFARNVAFQNATPFSQRLKYVNVLTDDIKPLVYSYDLGDAEVPSGGKITIDGSKIPTWLDTSSRKMWVDYSVVSDDAQANQKAFEAVTGGVTTVAQSEITFRTLTPLQDTGVALILVTVSSKYFDPKGATESVKTIELNKDSETFKIKPVYLVNRQAGEDKPGDPLFKFKLTVVKGDGTSQEGTQWTSSNGLTVYIGKTQLQSVLGTTPSTPDPTKPATPATPAGGGP
jgi:hypothetical protein